MKARRSRFARSLSGLLGIAGRAAFVVLVSTAVPACDLFMGSSKVAQGQRYQADDQRYDPYFENVHQAQVGAAAWPDEKKAARRPLVTALALTPGASDDTIVSATRERAKKVGGAKLDLASAHVTPSGAGDGPFYAAVEETVRLELDRARKLKDKSDKLDEMSKHGEELKKGADTEFSNRGADKADEKKTAKSREVRRELQGAAESTHDLSHDALKLSKEAQDFLEDLGDALEAKDAPARARDKHRTEPRPLPPPPPKAEDKKPDEKKPEDTKPAAKPKPAPTLGKPKERPAPPADKPAPAEKPAPKPAPPPDEVFNP